MGNGVVERVRQLWTPNREVEEILADLSPQSDLDSQIRDFFCRMIQRVDEQGNGPVTLDLTEPNTGHVTWSINVHEGRTYATIWHEP